MRRSGGARPPATASSARNRLIAFRRAHRTPRLRAHSVAARGLSFAVFTTAEVPGATPLVCVNGGLIHGHELLWPALAPLAERRQLVLYDQRGRGASEAPEDPSLSRIEDDAADLSALRRAIGVRAWDVLGHSWGGGIAALGAERDLEGTRRLVLVDPVGVTSRWIAGLHDDAMKRLDATGRAMLEHIDVAQLRSGDAETHSRFARALFPAWFADPSLAAFVPLPRAASATGAAVAGRLWRDGYDWRSLFRALTRPTIVIHGERDLLPLAEATELASVLPRATVAPVRDAGHLPYLESPELFFGLVEDFLTPQGPV
ncbi:MAG: alpha/beta hydrolase [Gemmatimonadota bacterium]|nr:alpha/beta hydrolase [Gemmatimonadota bacterium]